MQLTKYQTLRILHQFCWYKIVPRVTLGLPLYNNYIGVKLSRELQQKYNKNAYTAMLA